MAATTVRIGDVPFACVPLAQADFNDASAIYAILCVNKEHGWTILDIGGALELAPKNDGRDRRSCWEVNCLSKNIWVCVYEMPSDRYTEQQRRDFWRSLRRQYYPACGEAPEKGGTPR